MGKKNTFSIEHLTTISNRLLTAKRASAVRYINSLSYEKQLQLFLTTDPKNRMKMLSLFPSPKKIIRHISEEELYWTIKESGIKHSFPLFKYSSPEQTHFIFDIEWWHTDKLELKKIARWLNVLSRSGSKKIIQWFKTFDFELLILTLKQFVAVHKPHEGTDDYGESIEGLPDFTLDGVYFCFFPHKGTEATMRKLLRTLIAHDTHYYAMIMENIIWGLDTELEYETYHSTQRRLADKGIPELDDASEIYRFISDKEIESLPKKGTVLSKNHDSSLKSFYPIRLGTNNTLYIKTVLEQIHDSSFLEEFSLSIAHLANKILVADQFALSDHSSFKNKVFKAVGIANIGLETLAEKKLESGEAILKSYWFEHLFSIGWSKIAALQSSYKARLNMVYTTMNNSFLGFGSPLHEILVGITKAKPQFYTGNTESLSQYSDFKTIAELKRTEESIQYALFIHDLIVNRLGLRFPDYSTSSSLLDEGINKTYATLFLTGYAHKTLTGQWAVKPLNFNTVKIFLDTIFSPDFPQSNYSIELISTNAINAFSEAIYPINDIFLKKFVTSCFSHLEQEYLEATQDHFFDIIIFKSLWIEHFYSS